MDERRRVAADAGMRVRPALCTLLAAATVGVQADSDQTLLIS